MSEASADLHEPSGRLSDSSVELHRALVSLQEELQAIDWYRQRSDACRDPQLRAILEHNLDEEIEHAAMLLEWLRRRHAGFARQFDAYLYTEAPIERIEETAPDDETTDTSATACDDDDPLLTAADCFTVGTMKEAR